MAIGGKERVVVHPRCKPHTIIDDLWDFAEYGVQRERSDESWCPRPERTSKFSDCVVHLAGEVRIAARFLLPAQHVAHDFGILGKAKRLDWTVPERQGQGFWPRNGHERLILPPRPCRRPSGQGGDLQRTPERCALVLISGHRLTMEVLYQLS